MTAISPEPDSAILAAAALLSSTGLRPGRRGTSQSARLARLYAIAEETLGHSEKALAWLARANSALDGETPVALSATEMGARRVRVLLGQIAHGSAA